MPKTQTLDPKLLREAGAMKYLTMGRKGVARLRKDGILQAIEVGRARWYAVADLDLCIRWLRSHPRDGVTQDIDAVEERFQNE